MKSDKTRRVIETKSVLSRLFVCFLAEKLIEA